LETSPSIPINEVLLREGKPLALTPKVFETLMILVENRGRIVEKDELMRRLWPDTFVEQANFTFDVQPLRKRSATTLAIHATLER
jgi:DNA-binding winged helix-turn-helix (wHTH) protein